MKIGHHGATIDERTYIAQPNGGFCEK